MKYISTISGNTVECTEQDYIDRNLDVKGYIEYVEPIIPVIPVNPEDIFNYDLCMTELLKRFEYEFFAGCPLSCLQIQSLVQSKLTPFKAIAKINFANEMTGVYPEGYNTYNRLNALFLEQNINLESYLVV